MCFWSTRIINEYKKKSINFSKHTIVNNKLIIERSGDIYNLRCIQFINPEENFKFKSFSIIIGGMLISKIYIDICEYLGKENNNSIIDKFEIGDKKVINFNIPWNELGFTDIIKLVSLQFHHVEIMIDYEGIYENCYIYGNYKFLENTERTMLVNTQHNTPIIQMVKQNINHLNQVSEHNLLFSGLGNGLFFENFDFNVLNNVKLLLNGNEFINLDQFNYKSFLKKINKNTYYFSFDNTNKIIKNDYSYSINYSRIEDIKLVIDSNNHFNGKISTILTNIFKIMSGMGGIVFHNNLKNKGYIIQKIKKKLVGDNFCGVHFDNIEDGDEYISCNTCKKNFHTEITLTWVKDKKKCPHCNQGWDNLELYINS